MEPRHLLLLAPVAVAIALAPARAQEPIFWPEALDTVEVVAPRPKLEERLARPRGFVQVIPLGPAAPASADLGDLLDHAAGVQVRRYGGLGAMTLASVRGSSPSQVQVYIDGTPLSTAPDALANLSLLPVRLFDSIEIARGPLSLEEGGSAAGVVRLVTPGRFEEPPRVRVAAGSFGTRSLAGTAGFRRAGLSVLAAGGSLASKGDYPYRDRGGTPWEPADDRMVRRRNNSFHQEDMLLRARVDLQRNVQVDYTGHGLWKDGGIPGTESLQTRRVHDRFSRWLHAASVRGNDRKDTLWRLSIHHQEDFDRYRNPDAEVGLGRANLRSRLRAQGLDLNLGYGPSLGGSLPRWLPLRTATVRAATSLFGERWRAEDLLLEVPGVTRARTSRSLGLEGALGAPRLNLFASARWLLAEESSAGSAPMPRRSLRNPRLGATLDLGGGLVLRGSWGSFARLPSFVELFGQSGIQVGNPSLVPERGNAWDIGATIGSPTQGWCGSRLRSQIEVACFGSRTRDAILWIQNSQRTSLAQNLERTRVRGAEILLRAGCRPRVSRRVLSLGATAACTFQDARDDGPSPVYHGKRLPQLPPRQASLETRVEVGAARIVHRLGFESELYRDRYNSEAKRRGPRVLQDLEASWRIGSGRIESSLAILNLSNRRSQDVDGFPLPGRSLLLQITLTPYFGRNGSL